MQVIIHSNSNGGVSVTIPTGEISIQEVLQLFHNGREVEN